MDRPVFAARSFTTVTCGFLAAFGMLLLGTQAQALPGDAYHSYGSGGRFSEFIGTGTRQLAAGFDLDGKDRTVAIVRSESDNFSRIARIKRNGGLDKSFGSGGYVQRIDVQLTAIELDSKDRILVAGSNGTVAVVSRYLKNGAPDSSFADDGTWRFDLAPVAGEVAEDSKGWFSPDLYALRALDDGSVAIGGNTAECDYDYDGYSPGYYPNCPGQVAIRLSASGSPDPEFGDGGVRFTDLPERNSTVGFLDDGRSIIFGGYVEEAFRAADQEVLTLRVLSPNGKTLTKLVPKKIVYRSGRGSRGTIATDARGRILLSAGDEIYRLRKSGKLDKSFDENGVIDVNSGPGWNSYLEGSVSVTEMAVDANGRILISGNQRYGLTDRGTRAPGLTAFVARLLTNGRSDPAFSNDGFASIWSRKVSSGGNDPGFSGTGLAIDSSGRAIAGGSLSAGDETRVALTALKNGDRRLPRCMGERPTYLG